MGAGLLLPGGGGVWAHKVPWKLSKARSVRVLKSFITMVFFKEIGNA
jgi:hypothetical protein